MEDVPKMTTDSPRYAQLCESLAGSDSDLNVFPFDLSSYKHISIDPFATEELSSSQLSDIQHNISLFRDIIVFFTSAGNASGYGGHTGGAYDTVPEVVLYDAFFRACPEKFIPIFYDEAGHRVATQYLFAALEGYIAPEFLRFYRKGGSLLPGHPELGLTPGIKFSSGRLGHMWGTINGIAMAHPTKQVLLLGSDGSQMEGNNAEAARLAVAQGLKVKLVIDDNDITITGHPSDYLSGFKVEKTLAGHGLTVEVVDGENIVALYKAIRGTILVDGPTAVVCKRTMAAGIKGVEGTSHGHDAVSINTSVPYLEARGHSEAATYLKMAKTKTKDPKPYQHVGAFDANRKAAGKALVEVLSKCYSEEERKANIMVIDSDLGGSTSFSSINKSFPEIYVQSGVMERGNFAAAAGFGMNPEKQGVFSTFCAFIEMLCSEITMARLNNSNVFCHFSHTGIDDMSDNTCHFGINPLFADNGLNDGYDTALYFPCDVLQTKKIVERTFPLKDSDGNFMNKGLRFLFTTRSKTPILLKEDNSSEVYGGDYTFVPGKDEIIREGTAGYIVTFGDAVYRCLDAVVNLKKEGIDIGLINKPTLNIVDQEMMERIASSPMCLVVESLGIKTGLGSRFGSYLLMTKHAQSGGVIAKFGQLATHHEGGGGLWEQAYHQGWDSDSVQAKVNSMLGK